MPPSSEEATRLRLVQQVLTLPAERLGEAEASLTRLSAARPLPSERPVAERDWPHAPLHRLCEQGTYIVTAGTYEKEHHFRGPDRLDHLETTLLSQAKALGWQLEAWAVFSNHYHFVAHSPPDAESLSDLLKEVHGQTARHVNRLDDCTGRQVWFNFWETLLTFEKSYLARLSYVHQNAVKHGLVATASHYRWCSAAWLERTATRAQVETLYRFKTDRVQVQDDFAPV